ncbi:uncharacterized protein A1O9_12504 [Exophiala aquamarina CBS 119918]|uniref:FAD-binding domain-containing protein n=1 Tax=Exophiala aquamarina CBS 119918 TaxID=1182545 RepID=A0A072P6Z6_9EURO|nr:uncharacterized protein A1O9_12504 [Exophiala aquamarina CBS 119918]KEF51355.1 hypothetical protein A1O9_12504 [Exophiala aquamarina CBS 119918]
MGKPHVLVSGAGIAGPTVAFWLYRAGFTVTVVERSTKLRASGQNIDIRGHGLTIIERMDLQDEVRAKKTNEKGLRFVDAQDRGRAEFPVGDGKGFTGEIEIMRGDLAIILYEATKKDVEYVFGDYVKGYKESGHGLEVEFTHGHPTRKFDLLIAADGWSSKTRRIAFPDINDSCVKPLGQWGAWFSLPRQPSDSGWARWYNAPKSRMLLVRPDNENVTRASMWIMHDDRRFKQAQQETEREQKALLNDLFGDAGWETDRLLKGMQDADDFYIQQIAQIKLETWSRGRVVLVGDAAYCPTPISGMGTTVALAGAYVLAGEIVHHWPDYTAGFEAYEKKMGPFVAKAQKLAPGAPGLANPQTQRGISILYFLLAVVAWIRLHKIMGASFSPPATAMDLPDYGTFRR